VDELDVLLELDVLVPVEDVVDDAPSDGGGPGGGPPAPPGPPGPPGPPPPWAVGEGRLEDALQLGGLIAGQLAARHFTGNQIGDW
jgi:hypothetical protein